MALMLSLYLKFGAPQRLTNIEVAHVNHELKYDRLPGYYSEHNEKRFYDLLENYGIKSFDPSILLFPRTHKE